MAIFSKHVTHTLALVQTFGREAMGLNISVSNTLGLVQAFGRPHTKVAANTLSLSQKMHRTHAETLSSALVLAHVLYAINVGRVIAHTLSVQSILARSPSEFNRASISTMALTSAANAIKHPDMAGPRTTPSGFGLDS